MQSSIIAKLNRLLSAGINREADVVYLLCEIGKYLEQGNGSNGSLLRFYRNWAVHSRIDRTSLAGDFPIKLDNAISECLKTNDLSGGTLEINSAVSMERLRIELEYFLKENALPREVTNDQVKWVSFARLLISVLADVPISFKGFNVLQSFQFTEIEDGDNLKLAHWRINGKGIDLFGPVLWDGNPID